MKKLMFGLVAAAACSAMAEITSANVVGYSTQAVNGTLSCIGYQFADVGSADASIAALSIAGITPGVYDTMETEAPCIMIYNGSTYDYYYYISDAFDAEGAEVTAWADVGGDAADATVTLGTGAWLSVPAGAAAGASLTESGEVLTAATATIDIAAGLTLASNPYPVAFNMSKAVTAGIVPGAYDTMETDAPCIMVYNGSTYDYYYYISDAFDSKGEEVTAWADVGGDAVEGSIAEVGEAFWVRSATAGTITFSL